ncbi:Endonuclease/exonuclease/phosphatase [Trinorchestia longiramus]|nr:Endonuclease/exonuclease/phosphatase [Trinorchestia longiramus]
MAAEIYVKQKLQNQYKTERVTEKIELLPHLTNHMQQRNPIKILLVHKNKTRAPTDDDEFYGFIEDILSTPHEALIMGDFNLLYINWTTRQSRAPGFKLIELMNANSLQQQVNKPTRQNNILDLVMTILDFRIILESE